MTTSIHHAEGQRSARGVSRTRGWRWLALSAVALAFIGCATLSSRKTDIIAKADARFQAGDDEQAFTYLENEMSKDRKDMIVANYYRRKAVEKNKEDRSISFFKKIVQDGKAPDETYYNFAFAYIDKIPRVGPMGAGFLSKRSIAQFQAVAEHKPDDWVANYGIGMNYLHWPDYFKKTDSAESYFEKCLTLQKGHALRPEYLLTYLRYGDALVRSNQLDQAYETWREGAKQFPNHPDLVDRLSTPKTRIADAIKELYNPNNSIGAINTDISILWAREVPKSAVPLRANSLQQAGVGGQISAASGGVQSNQIGLFAWFTRNLQFLSDKNSFAKVDMSPLGVKQRAANDPLVNSIAHGMIIGMLTELQGDDARQIAVKGAELDGFTRPFYHEGVGMGYAATLSIDDVSELRRFVSEMSKVDPNYMRLHLAGAGMWFGLESEGNIERVQAAFAQLGPFGEAYAYEGYGFARTLFYWKSNPDTLRVGAGFKPEAAHNFYHGTGRAFWILNGADTVAFTSFLAQVPADYREDVYSGFGMGVSFTKPDDPKFVFALPGQIHQNDFDTGEYLTGATMGYTIRSMVDPVYTAGLQSGFASREKCKVDQLVVIGKGGLSTPAVADGDGHYSWRQAIHTQILTQRVADSPGSCG
jgi:tetratricopeptide (TPR) repeat protein